MFETHPYGFNFVNSGPEHPARITVLRMDVSQGSNFTIKMGEHWNTPIAMKNVPAYFAALSSEASSMIYPTAPTTVPHRMNKPRRRVLSEKYAVTRTVMKSATFGGTVNSWAIVDR